MGINGWHIISTALALGPILAAAQLCSLKPSGSVQPTVASGYQWQLVATGLSNPRGIMLDKAGNLLVVEKGTGRISAHQLSESNGCMSVQKSMNVTQNMSLNHGIEMSSDGQTLYGSSTEAAYSWAYDSGNLSASSQKTLVANMTTDDHTTRTLLLSQKVPGMLVVTRGSTSNIDFEASELSSGHSQVKAFDLSKQNGTTYDFNTDGTLLGWGLRNDVGIAEQPVSGGLYSVENSADQLNRSGVDVHQNNPAEKLNFLGYLNGTPSANQGGNFGYPWCFTAWNASELPDNSNLTTGRQFAVDATPDSNNQNKTDEYCSAQIAPRLSFQAHMAPLDIKFNNTGREAWITWHGSWDRSDPVGYKMSVVSFTDAGEPVDATNSMTAATDIFSNMDNSKCPDDCFRPVAMAIDGQGRIFVSSDATGEIYMVSKAANGTSGGSSGNSSSTPASDAGRIQLPLHAAWSSGAGVAFALALAWAIGMTL